MKILLQHKKGQILIETLIAVLALISLILLSIKGIQNTYQLNKKNQHRIYQKNTLKQLNKKAGFYA